MGQSVSYFFGAGVFNSLTNYSNSIGKDYVRVVSCNTTGLSRTLYPILNEYGIDNVRGGSFTKLRLSDETKKTLRQMSNGTNDKCFKCGEKGHFAKDCYSNLKQNKKRQCQYIENESSDEELEEGIYEVNGKIQLYYENEWFEESPNNPGHRDGTFGIGGREDIGIDVDDNWNEETLFHFFNRSSVD